MVVKTFTAIEGEVVELHWLAKPEAAGGLPGERVATVRQTCPPKAVREARLENSRIADEADPGEPA